MEKGIEPGAVVGIMINRSVELVIAILGVLKAGGAYLIIDTDYPEERKNYMLADSGVQVLLTGSNCQLSIVNCQLSMNSSKAFFHHSDLAYIIYTSGSTGRPKE